MHDRCLPCWLSSTWLYWKLQWADYLNKSIGETRTRLLNSPGSTSESGCVQEDIYTSVHLLNMIFCRRSVVRSVTVQLLPPLFFSATSSICLCLLSKISIFLASLRARSWALSASTSSKNLCLHAGGNIILMKDKGIRRFKFCISNKVRFNISNIYPVMY